MKTPLVITNNTHPFFPSDNIVTWSWDYYDGGSSNLQNPPPYVYQTAGQYYITLNVVDNIGCGGLLQKVVNIEPIPEITVYPRRDTICMSRDTSILSAYTTDPFVWTPAANISCNNCDTIKVWPAQTTYYVATATNIGGCSNTDTSFIRVFGPINMNILPGTDISLCPKDSKTISVHPPGVTTWSPAIYLNDSTSQTVVVTPDESAVYTIIIKDSANCYADTTTLNVNVYSPPLVNAGPDLFLAQGTAFTLSPQYGPDVQGYLWTPATNLACTTCASPSGTAEQGATYTIAVTDSKGCKNKDEVKINLICGQASLYMPSAFTPFNGGANNYFYPLAKGYKTIKSFIIYNRFGNKVFERKDFSPNISTLGWNGNVKGDLTHGNEAFVWFVEAKCDQGEMISAKGSVLLIR